MKNKCKSCARFYGIKHECVPVNRFINNGDYCQVFTNKNDYFLIDKVDLPKILHIRWHKNERGYIRNSKSGFIHRIILNVKDSKVLIDHINGNKSDNRRSNLRLADDRTNQLNTNSKGYCYNKKSKKWLAYVRIDKHKTKHLGTFTSEEDAKKARYEAEELYYGKFMNKEKFGYEI